MSYNVIDTLSKVPCIGGVITTFSNNLQKNRLKPLQSLRLFFKTLEKIRKKLAIKL